MIAQPLDLFRHFLADVFLKGGIAGHHGSAKHEILPDHDSQLIADVIEIVGFVVAAAPVADHIHVSIAGRLQNLPMLRRRDTGREAVKRDYIGAFGEDWDAIHHEGETLAPLIGFAAQLERTEAGAQFEAVFHIGFLAFGQGDGADKFVQRLRPVSIREPEFRVGDTERNRNVIRALVEMDFLFGSVRFQFLARRPVVFDKNKRISFDARDDIEFRR